MPARSGPRPNAGQRRYDFGAGEETDALRARDEVVLVSHELQDRYARREWNFTALDVVLSGIYRTDIPRRRPAAAERERALNVLRRLGVAALAPRRFLELSRGEQRRVLIARGVAFEPTVLLLDEPASGLDARSRVELDAMLALVAQECTLVCAAHVPHDLPSPIGRYLRIDGRTRRDRRARHANGAGARLDSAPRAAATNCCSALQRRSGRVPLIELMRADAWLAGRRVLHGVTWRLMPGEHWLVTGANGSGKSSFLRMLHGQLRPALGGVSRGPRSATRVTFGSCAEKSRGCRRSCKRPIAIRRRCARASPRGSRRVSARRAGRRPTKRSVSRSCSTSSSLSRSLSGCSARCRTAKRDAH